ncbi:MAG: D-alanyl-D-alanine carboxypeptidase [Akkermansia sp.]|nr:D-alanyl-D-alanine carboxypeptidase [Akkermansia sp.]MBQ7022969.1 D-alanyl-D-alanine carboxypeptidase [Akkermansia sp.]
MKRLSLRIVGLVCAGLALLSSCTGIFSGPMAADMKPSYLAMETNSGRILYASNPNERRPIGMLANIATAVVVLDWVSSGNVSMETQLTVPESACQWPATNLLHLRPGDRISLRDALHSAIMWDDSACAATLAYACGSTLSMMDPDGAFVAQMNRMAAAIGMNATRFKGSNGSIVSLASTRDLALLGMYAIEKPQFKGISSKKSHTATITNAYGQVRQAVITNSNRLLAYDNVDGVRAARSKSAGCCIIATSTRTSVKMIDPRTGKPATYGQRLLVVVAGARTSEQRYKTATNLLRDSWSTWEDWQRSNDFSNHSQFIILPH